MTAPQRVFGMLWTLVYRGVTRNCVLVSAPDGEELRVLEGDTIYLSELLADRVAVMRRSEQLRLEHEYRGWIRIQVPPMAPPVATGFRRGLRIV